MTSHQTIVVELGSSRIKVGFAGESKPRRILNDDRTAIAADGGSSWSVSINDGPVSNACHWSSFFQYLSTPDASSTIAGPVAVATTSHEWEKALYPLFSYILTSILFIQRPSRHKLLILINELYPPQHFQEALHRVTLEYLNVGGVWLVNGGVFESLYYLLEGMPPPTSPSSLVVSGRPKAHLLVDIGTHEARIVVSVAGSSILLDTLQTTMVGYQSFLQMVLTNYKEMNSIEQESDAVAESSAVTTLEDANAIVQTWMTSSSNDNKTMDQISVNLPSQQHQKQSNELPTQPLLKAFHQTYLDYSNPSSLIYAMLTCVVACPMDYRRVVLENILLLGGGSVALRNFSYSSERRSGAKSTGDKSLLGMQLQMAAKEACGCSSDENDMEEEKKEDSTQISSIAKQRFQCLKGAVSGSVSKVGGERIGGINIQYPTPFAADFAAWIGGSIMGTLAHKNYRRK